MLITILVGSSGSGKSTHAKTLGQVICSTDKYVEEQASILGVSYDKAFKMSQSAGIFKKFTKYFYEDIKSLIDKFFIDGLHILIKFVSKYYQSSQSLKVCDNCQYDQHYENLIS